MAAKKVSARIICQTGRRLACNIALQPPSPAPSRLAALLVIANTINIAADLAAMGASMRLIVDGSALIYALLFGIICLTAEIFIPYHRYAGYLKFLTMALLVYVGAAFTV